VDHIATYVLVEAGEVVAFYSLGMSEGSARVTSARQ